MSGAMQEYVMAALSQFDIINKDSGINRTDHHNVGVNGHCAAPRDGAEARPLGVESTGRVGQEFVQQSEDNESNNLGEHAGGDGQPLDDEVGNVKV
jgi:hypothetical protein